MTELIFTKYTAHGNNFVIIDETSNPPLPEQNKKEFAWHATNLNFGVGCDNLLVIENANRENMLRINAANGYWPEIPDFSSSRFLFRMFEPDGSEAHACGNGLMCIADYLYHQKGISQTRILTRIPSLTPLGVEIGKKKNGIGTWVNLGNPQRPPIELVRPEGVYPCSDSIWGLKDIKIQFRSNDLKSITDNHELRIAGYIVFTGEPHLVIFVDSGFSIGELAELTFIPPGGRVCEDGRMEKRHSFGGWLLRQIGMYLNKQRIDLFPHGINVNFARVKRNGSTSIEFRTFERGINKETLSCGTGSVAVAYVAKQLNLVAEKTVNLLPHKARWFDPMVRLQLEDSPTGWKVNAAPKKLFDGQYNLESAGSTVFDRNDVSLLAEEDEPVTVPSTAKAQVPDTSFELSALAE